MKRLILFLVFLAFCVQVTAQNKLCTDAVFSAQEFASAVLKSSQVSGRSLAPYNLDSFRSITLAADGEMLRKVENLVNFDVEKSLDADMERDGGRLVYALLRFPGANSRKQEYLGYQVKSVDGALRITIVRMAGKATVEDLKSFFKNK